MNEQDLMVPMLNRGRVVYVPKSEVAMQIEKGWIRIENPKQDYYPQYDQAYNKMAEDDRVAITRLVDNDDYVDRLGVIQV
jgi:hypothetical protein